MVGEIFNALLISGEIVSSLLTKWTIVDNFEHVTEASFSKVTLGDEQWQQSAK